MPSFKYDDTPRKAYEEPGEYQVTVEHAEWQRSSTGNLMIKMQLRTDGGALVFDNLVMVEKAFWKVSAAFAALLPSKGYPALKKNDVIDYDERQDWLDDHLVGARGWVLLSKGTSTTGKVRNEVDNYLPQKKADKPVSGPTTKPTPAAPTSAATTKPKAKASFPKDDDDDVPF